MSLRYDRDMAAHTVIVVEDDPVTREHLAAAVRAHPELAVLAAVGSCAEARAALKQQAPRVLLVDLGLPDGDGATLIREATQQAGTDAMVVTVFGDERHVVTALEAGAAGYLLKDSPLADIAESVLRVIQGESPISAKIARYLVRRFQQPATEPPAVNSQTLTEREREVLHLLAKGFSYGEVAQSLEMSPHTVASHIKHIYRKLAVSSRGEAVFEAASLGLIRLKSD